jgi:transposase
MVKKFKVKLPNKKRSPRGSCESEEDTTEPTLGRAALGKLSSVLLKKLMQYKKVWGRSKYRTKASMVAALEGTITPADLGAAGIKVPALPEEELCVPPEHKAVPGRGMRLNEPAGGTDVHMANLVAAIITPAGREIKVEFPNTDGGAETLARFFQHHNCWHVAMESTAEYWLKPFWILSAAGIDVLVANPVQTKATQGVKTDWKDAIRLALALRDGRLKPSLTCTPEQYARKKLNRDATKRAQEAGKALTRLEAMFEMFDAPAWVAGLPNSQRGLRVLAGCLELEAAGDIQEVLAAEYAKYKGKITDPAQLAAMAADLAAFLGRLGACPDNRVRFGQHLETYSANKRMATQLRTQLLGHAAADARFREDLEFLVSAADVGTDTALTLAVEIVDVRNFLRAKSLAKWAGLAPRVNQSGHRKRHTGHIFKGGNKWVRRACYLAAKEAYMQSGNPGHPIGEFVSKLFNGQKKPFKVAVVAGARKLLTLVYHMLAERKTFAELWPELAEEEAELNHDRKVKELKRRVKQASTADLLPAVAAALRRQCDALGAAETAYAAEISAILGDALNSELVTKI